MIKLNSAQCGLCKDTIVSRYRHNFVECRCGEIFIDGGNDYLRRGAKNMENLIDRSIVELMYTEILERCGYEGETWSTFIPTEKNKKFLEKLRRTMAKFPDIVHGDSYLEIGDEYNEQLMRAFLRRSKEGYFDSENLFEGELDPDIINDESEEAFIDSFYKRSYFR